MKRLVTVLLFALFSANLITGKTCGVSQKPVIVERSRPGLLNITELNFGFGLGDTNADYAKRFFGLTSVLGYGISKNLNIGFDTGLSFYEEGMLIPLFLDLIAMIDFGKISAYTFGDVGLLLDFSK